MFPVQCLAIKLPLWVLVASGLFGCRVSSGRPTAFAGKWQSICTHPTMTEAAYREAFECHRAARTAALQRAQRTARLAREADRRALVAGP